MATKTWKIGEYCKGGIITVETTAKTVKVIGKQWDYKVGSRRSSNQSNAKEWTRLEVASRDGGAFRKLDDFLNDLTSSYYAGQVMSWIKTKVFLN